MTKPFVHLKIFALSAALLTAAIPASGGAHAAEAGAGLASSAASTSAIKTFAYTGSISSPVQLISGTAMVPLRELAEALGWKVTWQPSGITMVSKGQDKVTVKNGQTFISKNGGSAIQLPVRVQAINGKIYVPARQTADTLGGQAGWETKTKSVVISLKTGHSGSLHIVSSFNQNAAEGWTAGFADLPVEHQDQDYQLQSGPAAIPAGSGTTTQYGFKLSGMNRSDDLFMFISRKLGAADGIKPNTSYTVKLGFDLAAAEAAGSIGIGGSPGQSVYVKAGVVNTEPKAVKVNEDTLYYRLNLDKGNQSTDGKDLKLLGNIGPDDMGVFASEAPSDAGAEAPSGYYLKHFEQSYTVTSSASGELYVILGTDSGFEGLTTIYFTNINMDFAPTK